MSASDRPPSLLKKAKHYLIGDPRNLQDTSLFHNLSLIAFFAWVGLGADGLSSSSYGPEEAFLALNGHIYLSVFIALGSAITVFIISASYAQIIEHFPSGGGGYLVASKLLSPTAGMISGCALLIDYVLTITISIASGADALFSFLPPHWHAWKLNFAIAGVVLLTVMNLRGVRESIIPVVPVFLMFVATHFFGILYAFFSQIDTLPWLASKTVNDIQSTYTSMGLIGMSILILRSYSMGAGTYTGIEAVSNGLSILREPRVQTAKRTMRYMAYSLAFTAFGLTLSYLLYQVSPQPGKTLNAVLFEHITKDWGSAGYAFLFITLLSEATILFVAAQAGFLDGPRVLSNMALDRWFPTKFAMLSDRFVTQNGILLMGAAAIVTMIFTHGSVRLLVVLYSINVFITFVLSQLGMVRYWWKARSRVPHWPKKMAINGIGLVLCTFILVSVTVLKFHEGGWITLIITACLAGVAIAIRRHYDYTSKLLRRLDDLVLTTMNVSTPELNIHCPQHAKAEASCNPNDKTAVLLVNGFNGLGLHTLFSVIRLFEGVFKNFIFVQVGVIDAGVFKGAEEIAELEKAAKGEVEEYVDFMRREGYCSEGFFSIGIDVVDEIAKVAPKIIEKYPNAVFFGGQLVFPEDTFLSRWLHNYIVFAIQRRFYHQGVPFVILPIRV